MRETLLAELYNGHRYEDDSLRETLLAELYNGRRYEDDPAAIRDVGGVTGPGVDQPKDVTAEVMGDPRPGRGAAAQKIDVG